MTTNKFVNEVADKAKSAAEYAAKKTNNVIDLTKTSVKIMETQSALDKAYIEIGKLAFNAHKNEIDNTEDINEKFNVIEELNAKLVVLKDAIIALKGHRKCSTCGKENTTENIYCGSCGASLKD